MRSNGGNWVASQQALGGKNSMGAMIRGTMVAAAIATSLFGLAVWRVGGGPWGDTTTAVGQEPASQTLISPRSESDPVDPVSIWPQFRGPRGDGVAEGCYDLPVDLAARSGLAWRVPLPGSGWSSPVLDERYAWMTAAVPVVAEGPEANAADGRARRPKTPSLDLVLLAFDRLTGEKRQQIKLFHLAQPETIHSLNSYASPTPVLDRENIYCHFGTYGTAAVRRADGEVLWKSETIQLQHVMGPGSSPVLFENRLIFHADGVDTQSIVALDGASGEVLWQVARTGEMSSSPDQKKAYCTPQITVQNGQPLLVSPAANWLYVYDPRTGSELYRVSYGQLGYSTVPRPVIDGSLAYICTGFDRSRLMCIDLNPELNVPPSERIRWTFDQRIPTMPSPVLVGGLIYVVSDAGIATCLDQHTGEEVWSERLGGKFSSSPLLADGKIYIGNQAGEMFVLRPGRELNLLGSSQLDGAIMAAPVAVGNELYIRTSESLYRFGPRAIGK